MDSGDSDRTHECADEGERCPARTPGAASNSTPQFRLIYCTVVALTVLALAMNLILATFGGDSDLVTTAAETCSTTYKMGFGAIVGLIGGRA